MSARARRWEEGFFAERGEIALRGVPTECAGERAERLMEKLEAGVVAAIAEDGGDLAVFEFGVVIAGDAELQAGFAKEAGGRGEGGLKIEATLAEIDADALVSVRVGVGIVGALVGVSGGGDAVEGVVSAEGEAEEGAIAEEAETGGGSVDGEGGVGNIAVNFVGRVVAVFEGFGEFGGAAARGFGEARDLDVAGLAAVGIEVPSDGVGAAFEDDPAAFFVVDRGRASFGADMKRLIGTRGVDAVIDGVDHAADGVASVEERGGAANDFDPFDQ